VERAQQLVLHFRLSALISETPRRERLGRGRWMGKLDLTQFEDLRSRPLEFKI